MNYKPLGNQIFVKESSKEEMRNGIYIPSQAQKHSNVGVVVACGDGRMLNNGVRYQMNVKVGDKVYFDPMDCREITLDGEDYVILMDEEIIAVEA